MTAAVELDGSGDAYLTTGAPAVDTGAAFAVSAWVRPDALDAGRTVVCQGGFRLGSGADGRWSFGLGETQAEGGTPEAGKRPGSGHIWPVR
ncbi:LamG-like jellyroll fold domain-containing protein [Streptomyces sp. NPDC002845]